MDKYCHNCKHWAGILDSTHCGWCLKFFYRHGRMPLAGETLEETWEQRAVRISDSHFSSLR